MKILFVTPYLPAPPRFGGQRRIDGLMRFLAERHEVSVLSFNRTDEWESVSLVESRKFCHAVYSFPNLEADDRRLKRVRQLRSLASRNSYEFRLGKYRSDFQQKLDELLEAHDYDVVQVEFCTTAVFDFGSIKPETLLVLDEHNVEYDLQRRAAQASAGSPRQLYNEVNWRKLRKEERAAWARFNGVVLTSPRDQQLLLADRPQAKTAVVPNASDVEAFLPSTEPPVAKQILFFGALGYYPNEDGVIYLVDEILPLILQRHPDAQLKLVGPGALGPVLERTGPNIEMVGFVDDIQATIDEAAVVVVPLRVGGGTRLKIVEAMAKGKAIVSTKVGAEGINIDDDVHLLLRDGAQEFADAVCAIFEDEALARRLGAAARKRAEDQYSWANAARLLEEFYSQLQPAPPA